MILTGKIGAGILYALVALLFLMTAPLSADPVVREGNSELLLIESPNVDFALREWAMDNAKYSVDLVSLTVGFDDPGVRILTGMRRAAERGLKVRSLTDEVSAATNKIDNHGAILRLLNDSNLKNPIDGIVLSSGQKKLLGLRGNKIVQDFIHEKMLIIDAGTPQEIIFIGGRNGMGFDWYARDITAVLRPINNNAPHIGSDLVGRYDYLFNFVRSKVEPVPPKPAPAKLTKRIESVERRNTFDSRAEQRQLSEIQGLLSGPAKVTPSRELKPFQFQPTSMELLVNNIPIDSAKTNAGKDFSTRLRQPNPALSRVIEEIGKTDRAGYLAYIFNPPDALASALNQLVSKGGEVSVTVNGHAATRDMYLGDPIARVVLNGLNILPRVVDLSLNSSRPLFHTARTSGGNMNLNLYHPRQEPSLTSPEADWGFLHAKLLTLGTELSVLGSDNWNKASSAFNTEASVLINDSRLNLAVRSIMARINILSESLNETETERRYANRPWYSGFCTGILQQIY